MMLDDFRRFKSEYDNYILLFKSGSFYIGFNEDAIVLHKLFNYKIVTMKNSIKVGFPL